MSSPAPSDAGEQDNKKKGVVTFRFCSECSNMLYPKEDEIHRRLMFECRTCAYTEEAASTRVFQHNMTSTSDENADVTPDVGSDPTVGSSCSSGSTPSGWSSSTCAPPFAVLCFCSRCVNATRCGRCQKVLMQDSVEYTMDEDDDDAMDYEYMFPYDEIDESSEESLVESLVSSEQILSPRELLSYVGETSQLYKTYDNEDDEDADDIEREQTPAPWA